MWKHPVTSFMNAIYVSHKGAFQVFQHILSWTTDWLNNPVSYTKDLQIIAYWAIIC